MTRETPCIDMRPEHFAIVRDILCRCVPDREVWAFGSRARGTAKPYSDLDLAIIGEAPLPLDVSAILAEALCESDLPYKVDIVDWAKTDDAFRDIIRRDKVVVQRDRGGDGNLAFEQGFGEDRGAQP
jgi:predicted nucleotidyltransferase